MRDCALNALDVGKDRSVPSREFETGSWLPSGGQGDADDRAFREKVYRSAFAALDRALNGNASISADVAAKRRHQP